VLTGLGKYCGEGSPSATGVLKLEMMSQYSGRPMNKVTKNEEMVMPLM